jgi:tetratricopeptide (TPR) repeat protein
VTRSRRFAFLLTAVPITALLLSAQSASNSGAHQDQKAKSQSGQSSGAQPSTNKAPGSQLPPSDEDLPPEEDDSVAPRTYAFNPMESDRNVKVGNFYMHQGTQSGYRAAAGRYSDATKYNPTSADAFFKLGEAEEKLKRKDAAKAAYHRVLQIAPESKLAKEAKKKLAKG